MRFKKQCTAETHLSLIIVCLRQERLLPTSTIVHEAKWVASYWSVVQGLKLNHQTEVPEKAYDIISCGKTFYIMKLKGDKILHEWTVNIAFNIPIFEEKFTFD